MILAILKGIGIVLLILIGLFIFIVGTVLFVPIRYRFEGSYQEMLNGEACIKWTPVFLKVFVNVKDNQMEYIVKMFGGVIMTNTDAPISWLGKKIFSSDEEPKEENDEEYRQDNKKTSSSENISKTNEVNRKTKTAEKEIDSSELIEDKSYDKRKKRPSFLEKIRRFISKCKKRWKNFLRKLREIRKKKDELLKVYHSKRFDVAKKDVKEYLKKLFSIIKPDKLEGYLHFGMEDPAVTGQMLGVIATIYPLYQGFLTINPDFTEKCLDGTLKGKGKIFLFSIVKLGIKVILNKNLIKVTKKVQTILEA